MDKPLCGIRVLDLGRFISCPYCGLLLADLGAEVIRVEKSGGAPDRYYELLTPSGDTYHFVSLNRNKKGISLNFETNERARDILTELVKRSDVVMHNFSYDAAKFMSITYDNLKKIKPDIILAQISGFGSRGPYSRRIGFDMVAKAMSGAMSISGFAGVPLREQVPWVDYGTGSLTAVAILAALYYKQQTGQGQLIDTSLLGIAVNYMAPIISEWETAKVFRQQVGNRRYWTGPCDLYETKDGKWIFLALLTDNIWKRFCRFINRDDLIRDSRFKSDLNRWEHREIIDPVIKEWVASQNAEEVIANAEIIPIPAGLCYSHTEVARDPQVIAEDMLTELPIHQRNDKVTVSGIPFNMSGSPLKIERSFPAVGENNEEIYSGLLGYGYDDLVMLAEQGII